MLNISANLAVIDPHALTHMQDVASTTAKFASLVLTHAKAIADGILTEAEAHELSLLAAMLSVQADLLSRALEAK